VAIGRKNRSHISTALRTGLLCIALTRGDAALADSAWCASIYGPDGGYVTCAYATRDQCVAAASGVGGICHPNPAKADTSRVVPSTRRPGHR
jgi:hypothetical protein